MNINNQLFIEVDGACRGNPGPASIAIIIKDENEDILEEYSEYIGRTTNNEAEYTAVIKALEKAAAFCTRKITIYSDSELVINQLNRTNRIKDPRMFELHKQVKQNQLIYEDVQYLHINRENNRNADNLANQKLNKFSK